MRIIIKPIITEKMTQQGERLNRFGFFVDRKANKLQIKQAIKDLYGVEVESISTMIVFGKTKSRYTKSGVISGRVSSRKKAIVTLAKGDTIDFYSNI